MSNTITLKYTADNITVTSDAPKTLALGELAVSGLNANNASTDAAANYLTLWIGLGENTVPLPLSGWHRENNTRTLMALTPLGATFIDSDSDLNDIKFLRVGTYHSYYDSDVTSIVNKPPTLTQSFMMRVYSPVYKAIDDEIESPNNDVYRVREIITCTGVEYIQYVHKSGDVWTFGNWNLKYTSGNLIGAVSTIATSDLTANRALISNSDGKIAVSAVTATELGYLAGATSAIQTQLNGKLSTTGTAAKATADASGNEITRFYGSLMPIGATIIPANADLNSIEYLKVGTYLCSENTTVTTLTNCPTSSAFTMKVYSPITASIDNESTSTHRQRVREILTDQGTELIQYVMNSSSVAGEWEYQDWGLKYNSVNLNGAPEIVELQEDIVNLTTIINNQITYGSGNGWSWIIFPDNSIIMRSVATVYPSTTTSSSGLYYTNSIPVYFPSNIIIYDGVFTGTTKGSRCWLINAGVYEAGNGVYFRIMTNYSSINQEAVTVNCFVYGSLVPITYPETPSVETTGTAITNFKIWSSPSRNMKVTYVATRTSDTTASITLTYTYTMNTSAGTTSYAQYVTPTINNVTQSRLTLKSTSNSSNWYNDPIIKNVTYTISNLSASTTSITLSCKFEDTDSDTGIGTNPLTKTGTINLAEYS